MASNTGNNNLGNPKSPSPEPGEPPMETSPGRGNGLQRSNAIRRIGSAMVQRRREGLSNVSRPPSPPSSAQQLRRPFSFERPSMPNRHIIAGEDASPSLSNDEWARSDMRRLSGVLTSFVKSRMPVDEIGHYLDKIMYGRDRSLGGMVTNLVNDNLPYAEIGHRVLKNLDLRDDGGYPLCENLEPGDPARRPNRPRAMQVNQGSEPQTPPISPPRIGPRDEGDLMSYENPNSNDPALVCQRRLKAHHKRLEREAVQRLLAEDRGGYDVDVDSEADTIVASDDNNSASSGDTDRSEAMTQFAEEVYIYEPGPARFYTQYNNTNRTAAQLGANVHAANAAAAASSSGPAQRRHAQGDTEERPLLSRKPRFPID